jgi:ankyrin repeat protein
LGVVNALLKSPTIEVNPENIQRDCLLHLVRYKYSSAAVIVSKLLDLGADVSACNGKGESILHLVCAANASSIVDDLLHRGCFMALVLCILPFEREAAKLSEQYSAETKTRPEVTALMRTPKAAPYSIITCRTTLPGVTW